MLQDHAIIVGFGLPGRQAADSLDAAVVKILARCHYTSTGLEAIRSGANQVIVAEQAVAREMGAALDQWNAPHDDP
jgi:hypothetical protein